MLVVVVMADWHLLKNRQSHFPFHSSNVWWHPVQLGLAVATQTQQTASYIVRHFAHW